MQKGIESWVSYSSNPRERRALLADGFFNLLLPPTALCLEEAARSCALLFGERGLGAEQVVQGHDGSDLPGREVPYEHES